MTNNTIVEEDLYNITQAYLPWWELEGKNILITGANGMLPSYMVETILYLNDHIFFNKAKVFAIVRNIDKTHLRFNKYLNRSDLIFYIQDIKEPLKMPEKMDYIVHAASNASPKYYITDPVGTLIPNTIGTFNCLELAKRDKVTSFLYFSSGEIYGKMEYEDEAIRENMYGIIDPLSVRACYAESKKMSETMCESWFRQYKIPTKIVRPFHTYGPHMPLSDGRVFSDLVANVVNKQDLIIQGNGSAHRTFCYIADATIAFFLILLTGKSGEAYNVGGDESFDMSVWQLANMLRDTFNEYNLNVIKMNNVDDTNKAVNRLTPNLYKINQLGWYPTISVTDGFKRTVESFL